MSGVQSLAAPQWNSIKIIKILFLNEDALAIVKSEASQCPSWLMAIFQLASRARFPRSRPALAFRARFPGSLSTLSLLTSIYSSIE